MRFKRVLFLSILLFVLAFLGFTKHSQAQTTCSENPTLALDTSVSTNPRDNPLNKVYTLKINNPNKTNCTYRLKASSIITNWTFSFHPVNNEATTLPNDNITVPQASCTTALCNEKRQFKVRATPKFQPDPGTTTKFTVEIVRVLGNVPLILDYVVNGNSPTTTPPPDGTNCKPNPPGLQIIPVQKEGKKGDSREYVVRVTNNDRGRDCKDKFTVKIVGDNPSGWNASLNKNELEVKGEKHEDAKLTIRSSQNANAGVIKTFHVRTQRKSGGHKVTGQAKYEVLKDSGGGGGGGGGGGDKCAPEKPRLEVSADKNSVKPGGKITYTVKVKNVDRGPCEKRNLSLQRVLPNDKWTGAWDKNNQFEIAKGVEKTFKLEVKSPNNATVGTKKITINLKNNEGSVINSKEVTYVVPGGVTPTPTIPTSNELLNVSVGVDGIGTTPRIPLGGNVNPTDPNRTLTIRLFKASDNSLAANTEQSLTYNPTSQKFEGSFDVSISSGIYNIYVSGPRFLTAQFAGSHTLTKGQTNTLPPLYLITGNINDNDLSENRIDMEDRHILLSCSIYSQDEETCNRNPNYKTYSDLNDDGIVDGLDFNLWIKEVVNQQGAILPDEGN